MTALEALNKAISVLDGQSALARVCGGKVKQAHVYNWINRDGGLPAKHAMKVQRACAERGDPVYAYELCPDSFSKSDFKGTKIKNPKAA